MYFVLLYFVIGGHFRLGKIIDSLQSPVAANQFFCLLVRIIFQIYYVRLVHSQPPADCSHLLGCPKSNHCVLHRFHRHFGPLYHLYYLLLEVRSLKRPISIRRISSWCSLCPLSYSYRGIHFPRTWHDKRLLLFWSSVGRFYIPWLVCPNLQISHHPPCCRIYLHLGFSGTRPCIQIPLACWSPLGCRIPYLSTILVGSYLR